MNQKNKIKYIDPFVLCLLMAIGMAFLLPNGAKVLHLPTINSIGISGVFFLYGLKLTVKEILVGARNVKLHLLVQLGTFLLFPLLVWLLKPVLVPMVGNSFWMGLFYLAALPSSVSSSVIMVSLAKGNVPGAMFNASLSGIIGIFVTPLWMSFYLQQTNDVSLQGTFVKLTLQILMPLALGLLLNKKIGSWAQKQKKRIAFYDKTIIVCIVYASFCKSIANHVFNGVDYKQLVVLLLIVVALFWMVMGVLYVLSKGLGFSISDRITATFCGTKKSLVHGSAMLKVLFLNNPSASLFLLPVMLYHTVQLMILAVIANKWGKRELDR